MVPVNTPKGAEYPLILYCHGASRSIPLSYFYGWLADLVCRDTSSSVPLCVASRFSGVHQDQWEILSCEGEIENLDGEVNDCLSMINAAWKLPFVRKNEFAMVGHSFGSGAGLLAAARANEYAKAVVSYDAWLVNPQRYYWDRMARRANNWLSWADFCNQPVKNQLQGLMTRSIVHNAHKLKCPPLFFIGGAYEGVFHQSHDDLHKNLKNTTSHTHTKSSKAADTTSSSIPNTRIKKAFKIQTEFLKKHYPPYKPDAER